MEENNSNNEKMSTEEIKKEAIDTAKQVKDTLKDTDLKKDASAARGFLANLFKNPLQEIEKVAHSSKNEFLKIAIIVLAIWLVATLLGEVINIFQSYSYVSSAYSNFGTFFQHSVSNVFSVIKALLAPILSLAALSSIIYVIAKDKKKPFVNIVTSVIIAKIPVVLASIVSLLSVFGSQVYKIINHFSGFCSILSIVLLYFTIKSLYDEKEDYSFIKTFAVIMGIFYIVKFVISFFGISI